MIGAAIGALAGGFIGARLAAPKVEIHEHYSERRSSGYSVFYDNHEAMKRELTLARKAHDKLMAQQEMAGQNTEEIKALLQMNLRIALMTEDEKLEFRRQMAEYEAEQREKALEDRVEQIIVARQTPQKLSKDEDRYENRKYILALIESAHIRKSMNDYWHRGMTNNTSMQVRAANFEVHAVCSDIFLRILREKQLKGNTSMADG
jgi:hypothetical protein